MTCSDSPTAKRMRLYRRHRRRGYRCVPLKVGRAEIDGLVAKGYLAEGDREDSRLSHQRSTISCSSGSVVHKGCSVTRNGSSSDDAAIAW